MHSTNLHALLRYIYDSTARIIRYIDTRDIAILLVYIQIDKTFQSYDDVIPYMNIYKYE